MAGFYRIEQELEESYLIADSYDVFYLVAANEVLPVKWSIGFCYDCSFIYWVEDLSIFTAENSFVSEVEDQPHWDEEMREWHHEYYRKRSLYEARFNRFLETRTSPPKCMACNGERTIHFRDHRYQEWIPHPTKSLRFQIVPDGAGITTAHLNPVYKFLTPEGVRLTLSPDEQERLTQIVKEQR